MKTKLITAALAGIMAAAPALADLTSLHLATTGPYAANGIPFADGYSDYLTLLNERDAGIGDVFNLLECETGYNTEKGVECYESTKGEGVLAYAPLSTGHISADPQSDSDWYRATHRWLWSYICENGEVFRNVFNFPANYWDGASVGIKHLLDINGGDISGKKIALVYHNPAYGKEPIRTPEELSKKHGYELSLLPVDHPGQEQKSQWLQPPRASWMS